MKRFKKPRRAKLSASFLVAVFLFLGAAFSPKGAQVDWAHAGPNGGPKVELKKVRILLASSLVPLFEDFSKVLDASRKASSLQGSEAFDFQLEIIAGSSPVLAKQIENGIKADFFVSADEDWVKALLKQGKIEEPVPFYKDRLALIANASIPPEDARFQNEVFVKLLRKPLEIKNLQKRKLAIALGQPETVPVGKLAISLLKSLQIELAEIDPIYAPSAQAALRMVEMKSVPFGIVFQSQSRDNPKIKALSSYSEASDPTVFYQLARLTTVKECDSCVKFKAFLKSEVVRHSATKRGLF